MIGMGWVLRDGARRVVFRAVSGACDKPVGWTQTQTDAWPARTFGIAPIGGQHRGGQEVRLLLAPGPIAR
jgi:hypothetical protein